MKKKRCICGSLFNVCGNGSECQEIVVIKLKKLGEFYVRKSEVINQGRTHDYNRSMVVPRSGQSKNGLVYL